LRSLPREKLTCPPSGAELEEVNFKRSECSRFWRPQSYDKLVYPWAADECPDAYLLTILRKEVVAAAIVVIADRVQHFLKAASGAARAKVVTTELFYKLFVSIHDLVAAFLLVFRRGPLRRLLPLVKGGLTHVCVFHSYASFEVN
jgi:hypothetical protein